MTDTSISELLALTESADLEAKTAVGRDGQGELPKDFFETYSAMANTYGGVVLLGVEELGDRKLNVVGIQKPERVIKALWDSLNNRQRVSVNLLSDRMVELLLVDGRQIIKINIPRARRSQRPVYCSQNPLTGTFRRNFEGDYRCDEETIKRMLVEQVEDVRDSRLLADYSLADL